jgi:hypothetical protein
MISTFQTAPERSAFGVPVLSGGAPTGRGYNANADVVLKTADGRDYNVIWQEFQQALTAFRAGRLPLVNLLTFQVTQDVEDVAQGGQILFERLSEFGIPESKRVSGSLTSFGYDLKYYGGRIGYTSRFLSNASAEHLASLHAAALDADDATVFRLMWQAIFSNVNRTAVIDGKQSVYPVYALYNADGVVPPQVGAKTFDGTHNHYVVSGAATIDAGDVEAAIDNVEEHGFTPANGATIVILAPTALVKAMKTWRFGGTATNGSTPNFDFIPSQGSPAFITPGQGLTGGGQVANTFQGLPVAGSYGDAIIVTSDYIPAGYFLTFATGGSQVTSNLVGLREHSNPSYRGLRLINGERAGYPLIDSYYEHAVGTGIRQRGAAVVTQIKASGSYDVPSFSGGFE